MTDLSVSGEEGHSTILLAHYIFWFYLSTKLLATLFTPHNCPKLLRNLTFVIQFAYFIITPKKKFLFFRATFEQLSLQKATFKEITGNFVENLEQLVESPINNHKEISNMEKKYFAVDLCIILLYKTNI